MLNYHRQRDYSQFAANYPIIVDALLTLTNTLIKTQPREFAEISFSGTKYHFAITRESMRHYLADGSNESSSLRIFNM